MLFSLLKQATDAGDTVMATAIGDQIAYRLKGWVRSLTQVERYNLFKIQFPPEKQAAAESLKSYLLNKKLIPRFIRANVEGLSAMEAAWLTANARH